MVGIHDAAGEQERVELIWFYLIERFVDGYRFAPFLVFPAFDLAKFGGDDDGVGPGHVERSAGFDKLRLLKTISGQDRDSLSFQIGRSHRYPPRLLIRT